MSTVKQIPMRLKPAAPYSERYFVPHSGVAAAYQATQEAVQSLSSDAGTICTFYCHGPKGVGKTHLLEVVRAESERALAGIARAYFFDFGSRITDDEAPAFNDAYEQVRRDGGLLFAVGAQNPRDEQISPHISSRLLAGAVFELSYATEIEFKAVIKSLLERHNINLTDYAIEYLLRRLPRKPLSFDDLFASIAELSLSESRPAGLGVIREVFNNSSQE